MAAGQPQITRISDLEADLGTPHDWHGKPATFNLTGSDPRARAGKVWVRKSAEGLIIAGEVDGPAPEFAESAADLMRKDHVEIWLALSKPEMPPIGWGNQFGGASCDDPDYESREGKGKLAACRAWEKVQQTYRVQLSRLFVRQWQLAPKVGAETFAAAANREIGAIPHDPLRSQGLSNASLPDVLKPSPDGPALRVETASEGYRFETAIPWHLFPPSAATDIAELYLLVEVYSAAEGRAKSGPYATTAPGRRYADLASFNRVRLDQPKRYSIGECRYALERFVVWEDIKRAYFFPRDSDTVTDVFSLGNDVGGYAYEPESFSPVVYPTHIYSKEVGPGESFCGPFLRHFKDGKGTDLNLPRPKVQPTFPDPKAPKDYPLEIADEDFAVRLLPGSTFLLREGPLDTTLSPLGTGQCGACEKSVLNVYAYKSGPRVSVALSVEGTVDGTETTGVDIRISADWQRATLYSADQDGKWTDQIYCLNPNTAKYDRCGVRHTPPPKKQTLKLDTP